MIRRWAALASLVTTVGCVGPSPATPTPTPTSTPTPHSFALVVSFISPGDGTDSEASQRLDDLVAATHPSPARTHGDWGKEGEHDECFDLTELSPPARAAFIDAVRKRVAAPSKRVDVQLGAPCRSRESL